VESAPHLPHRAGAHALDGLEGPKGDHGASIDKAACS
jgi:hypothetical protein